MKCARALALIAIAICFVACSNAQQRRSDAKVSQLERKALIVYLSRTNNTKAVAEFIHDEVGGTLVPLELEKPYPDDYRTTVNQVARENETGYLPPLKTKIERIEQYDVVFIGFPTWGMQLPPPMKSFLKQYNLKGKTVVPFNTNAGYGVGSSFATVKGLCPDGTVLEGFTTTGGIERDGIYLAIKDERAREVRSQVRDWLRRIKGAVLTTAYGECHEQKQRRRKRRYWRREPARLYCENASRGRRSRSMGGSAGKCCCPEVQAESQP